MAELGFIVVQIDGMGTSNRSKKFHDVCWKNLADAGLPDRILWIRAAAARYPCMDLDRVGIYGGSAGGQNAAAAVMTHGDFYKAAVADCGCHDNRMDKIWWNEQWMGWPVGPQYAANSNVTLAPRLEGQVAPDRWRDGHQRRSSLDDATGRRPHPGRQGFRAAGDPRLQSRRRRVALRQPPPRRFLCPQPPGRRTATVAAHPPRAAGRRYFAAITRSTLDSRLNGSSA